MKKIFFMIAVSVFLFSCSSDEESTVNNESSSGDKIPALEIEIPAELKGNKDAEELIITGTEMINTFSDTMEDIIQDNENLIGKNSDDLTFMEQIQVCKIVVQLVAKMAVYAPKLIELQSNIDNLKQGMSEEERKALEKIGLEFEQRMDEINKKYEYLED